MHVPCMTSPILPRAICALLLLSAACVRADLTILQEISSPDNPKSTMVTTTKCKGDKLRIDVAATASMIIDGKKGEMISLMHQQKVAIPMSQAVQKMASQLADKATASDPLQLQATGRKETLIGLPCEEYTGTISGQKATVWTTMDVPEYKEFSDQFLSLSPQLRQYQGPLARNAALQGFPVLTE